MASEQRSQEEGEEQRRYKYLFLANSVQQPEGVKLLHISLAFIVQVKNTISTILAMISTGAQSSAIRVDVLQALLPIPP